MPNSIMTSEKIKARLGELIQTLKDKGMYDAVKKVGLITEKTEGPVISFSQNNEPIEEVVAPIEEVVPAKISKPKKEKKSNAKD